MRDSIDLIIGKKRFPLSLETVINFYLVWYLAVDVLNGLFLKVLDFGEAISFGQMSRILILILLNVYFFLINKKFSFNIALSYFYFGFCLFSYYLINDFSLKYIPKEVIYFTKISTYPLIFLYAYSVVKDERFVHRMVSVTFWIYAGSIAITFLTGTGLGGYNYYAASKGFFYATNATAIIGLSLGMYYLFHRKDILFSLLVLVVLFLSGSKVFLVFILFIGYHYFLKFLKGLRQAKSSVFLYILVIVMLIVGSGVVYQKVWVERYKVRVESVLINAERAGLFDQKDLFSYYAFISYERAVNSKEAILTLNSNWQHYLTGLGYYYTKYGIFEESRFGKDDIESDFFDMLIMYGLIGLGLFFLFHLTIMFNVERTILPMVIVVFLYAIVAGHLVFNPMSYTLPAVLFGFYFRSGKGVAENQITN
ncbi:MAG: O-antigen ligase family protein [Cyclobacteriaceae bacterium]